MVHLTKLDLSKNRITILPDEIGKLIKLRHLDLYNNNIEHLPLSMGQLKSLRHLDLKCNPLAPALAKMIGPCLTIKECQTAAKVTVQFMNDYQIRMKEEKNEKQRQLEQERHAAKVEAENQKKLDEKQKAKLKRDKKKQKLKEKQSNASNEDGVADLNDEIVVRCVSCQGPSIFKIFLCTAIFWLLMAVGIFTIVALMPNQMNRLIENLPTAYQPMINKFISDARNYISKNFFNLNHKL